MLAQYLAGVGGLQLKSLSGSQSQRRRRRADEREFIARAWADPNLADGDWIAALIRNQRSERGWRAIVSNRAEIQEVWRGGQTTRLGEGCQWKPRDRAIRAVDGHHQLAGVRAGDLGP